MIKMCNSKTSPSLLKEETIVKIIIKGRHLTHDLLEYRYVDDVTENVIKLKMLEYFYKDKPVSRTSSNVLSCRMVFFSSYAFRVISAHLCFYHILTSSVIYY